jgi:DNA-binding protein Fis
MQQIEVPIDAIMEHVKNNQTSINKIESELLPPSRSTDSGVSF